MMKKIRCILEKEVIESQIGNERHHTIGETCYDESNKGIDHGVSSFFEFFFFTRREYHLDSGPADREDREDCSEPDEPSNDGSDNISSSTIVDVRQNLGRRNYTIERDICV